MIRSLKHHKKYHQSKEKLNRFITTHGVIASCFFHNNIVARSNAIIHHISSLLT